MKVSETFGSLRHARWTALWMGALLLTLCTPLAAVDVVDVIAVEPLADEKDEFPGAFSVQRSGSADTLTVHFSLPEDNGVTGGEPVLGADFRLFANGSEITGATRQVDIPSGRSAVRIEVVPIDDGTIEGREELMLSLSAHSSYVLGGSSFDVVTIADNDLHLVFTVRNQTLSEEHALFLDRPFRDVAEIQAVYRMEYLDVAGNHHVNGLNNGRAKIMTMQYQGEFESDDVEARYLIHNYGNNINNPYSVDGDRTGVDNMDVFDVAYRVVLGEDAEAEVGDVMLPITDTAGASIIGYAYGGGAASEISEGDVIEFDNDLASEGYTVTGFYTDSDSSSETFGATFMQFAPALETAVSSGATFSNLLVIGKGEGSPLIQQDDRHSIATSYFRTGVDVVLSPVDDDRPEAGQDVRVRILENPDYATQEPNSHRFVLQDDDIVTDIELGNNASEPSFPGNAIVTFSAPAPVDVEIPYVVLSGSSAVAGDDYETLSGTVSMAAGETSIRIPIVPILDSDEDIEFVHIRLAESPDYVLAGGDSSKIAPDVFVNILNSLGEVSIASVDEEIPESETSESTAPVTFVVTIAPVANRSTAVLVPFTLGGTANPGVDYSLTGDDLDTVDLSGATGAITIPANRDTASFTILPVDDRMAESDETVAVKLKQAPGFTIDSDNTDADTTINDNEPTVSVEVAANPFEGSAPGRFRIFYPSPGLEYELIVHYSISGTATEADYAIESTGTITLGASDNDGFVSVDTFADQIEDDGETVVLTLQSDNAYFINNDERVATMIIREAPEGGLISELPRADLTAGDDPSAFATVRARALGITDTARIRVRFPPALGLTDTPTVGSGNERIQNDEFLFDLDVSGLSTAGHHRFGVQIEYLLNDDDEPDQTATQDVTIYVDPSVTATSVTATN